MFFLYVFIKIFFVVNFGIGVGKLIVGMSKKFFRNLFKLFVLCLKLICWSMCMLNCWIVFLSCKGLSYLMFFERLVIYISILKLRVSALITFGCRILTAILCFCLLWWMCLLMSCLIFWFMFVVLFCYFLSIFIVVWEICLFIMSLISVSIERVSRNANSVVVRCFFVMFGLSWVWWICVIDLFVSIFLLNYLKIFLNLFSLLLVLMSYERFKIVFVFF